MRLFRRYAIPLSVATVFLLAVIACLPYWNQFQGDAYIHFVYARNIANGYFMQFTPGHITPGTTAPAWTLFMAGLFKLFGNGLPVAAGFVGVVLHGLSAVAALYFAKRLYRSSLWPGLSAGVLVAVNPFLAMWAPTGMETPGAVLVVLLSFTLFHQKRFLLTGLLMALACLLRPESLLLVVLLVMARPKSWLRLAGPSIVGLLSWWGLTYWVAGTPFPASWAARRLAEMRSAFTLSLGPLALTPIPFVVAGAHGPLVALSPWGKNRLLGLALVLLLVFFVFTFPASTYPGRYLSAGIAMVSVLGAVGWTRAFPGFKAGVIPLTLLTLLPAYRYTLRQVSDHGSTRAVFQRAAGILNAEAEPGQTLLAHEVQIAWFLKPDIRVISLDGVIDGYAVGYLSRNSDMQDFILDQRPDYWFTIKTPLVGYWSHTVLQTLFEGMITELLMGDDMSVCIDEVCYSLIGPGLYEIEYPEEHEPSTR